MDDCRHCPKGQNVRRERSHRSPRKQRYRPISGRKQRCSPVGCEPCSREELRSPCKPFPYCVPCESCPLPCRNRYCCPEQTESGLLNTIRSSIQRLFTGKKPNQFYMYSVSQLKCIEKLLDKLEEETCCIEGTMKQALECNCNIDCNNLRCSLNVISNRVEEVKCDLTCARDCYNPCRDRCEFELISCLMDKVCCLEKLLQGLWLQLECLDSCVYNCCATQTTCRPICRNRCCSSYKSPCFPTGCSKPCGRAYCKPECETTCTKTCDKPKYCGPRSCGKIGNICSPKGLCRTSSVIPVGVMLVKL